MKKSVFLLISILMSSALAQVDAPPLEPPYTNSDLTFEGTENIIDLNSTDRSHIEPFEDSPQQVTTQPTVTPQEKPIIVKKVEGKTEYIQHPDAKKGLYLIDSKNAYHYKTKLLSKHKESLSLKFGFMPIPQINSELSNGQKFDFADMYGDSSLTLISLDYSWRFFKNIQQLSTELGLGFFNAKGTGYFKGQTRASNTSSPPKEKYTFYGLPLSLGLNYRFAFSQRPWLAPYVSGGGTYYIVSEVRDDSKRTKFVGTPAAYASLGALFNLTSWDRELQFRLDREYGISNMWVSAEFKTIQVASSVLDLSSSFLNIGFAVDY